MRNALILAFAVCCATGPMTVQAGRTMPLWDTKIVPWITRSTKQHYVSPKGKSTNKGTKQSPWDWDSVITGKQKIAPGSVIWLREGKYGNGQQEWRSVLKGTKEAPIIIRQYPRERATVQGTIIALLSSHDVWYWGFEITNPQTVRNQSRKGGLVLQGCNNRAINLIVHDCAHSALSHWYKHGPENEAEFHGCVSWANGYYDSSPRWKGKPRGSFYLQNKNGHLHITNNISFRWFTIGIKVYTEGTYVDGFRVKDNICFDNQHSNILAWGGRNNMRDLVISNNYLYSRPEYRDRQLYIRKGIKPVLTDNVIAGGVCKMDRLEAPAVTGNTLYGQTNMPYGNQKNRLIGSLPTTGATVKVIPNKYQKGRAHIVIYNWGKAKTVKVDLGKLLPQGAQYEIRDAQNYFGKPVVTGRYEKQPINIPMDLTEVAMPVGEVPHIQARFKHTAPEFGAFVVVPRLAKPW